MKNQFQMGLWYWVTKSYILTGTVCRKHPGVEPKTSNMSGICGGTSGSHRLTHDQYNDGKGAAYLRDKKQVKKKRQN